MKVRASSLKMVNRIIELFERIIYRGSVRCCFNLLYDGTGLVYRLFNLLLDLLKGTLALGEHIAVVVFLHSKTEMRIKKSTRAEISDEQRGREKLSYEATRSNNPVECLFQ